MIKNEQYDLALEIVRLQDKIENSKKNNKHARLKCNLKKLASVTKLGMVFSAIPFVGTLITSTAGWSPFKLKEYEVSTTITTTIDKDGKETEKKEQKNLDECISLYYFTSWEKTDNNNYSRKKYVYKIYTSQEIIEILKKLINSKEELTKERIEELISEKTYYRKYHMYESLETEYTPTIQENSPQASYIEFEIHKKDNEEKIIIKEEVDVHIALIMLEIILEAGLIALEILIIYKKTYFFEKRKKELQESSYFIDTKELEIQLKVKQLLFENLPYQLLEEIPIVEVKPQQKIKQIRQQG